MAVREGLLAVLSQGPRHGYQIKTDFESMTGGVWRLNVGQVYTTLDRLERDGMVAVETSDESKTYSLTNEGRSELSRWWEPDVSDDTPPRDELMLKIISAIEYGSDHALAVVSAHRTALTTLLQKRRARMRQQGVDVSIAAQLVDDAVLMRAESDLRWLDVCETRITALAKIDSPTSKRTPR